jgi:dihydrolipoamide dehydrogenase
MLLIGLIEKHWTTKRFPHHLPSLAVVLSGWSLLLSFNSLGVKVTIVEMLDEILGGMDKELSAMLRAEYAKRGIEFY